MVARASRGATEDILHFVFSLIEMRRRLPVLVFIVLLILFVLMLGFVCLCISDHPSQAADRAIGAIAHAPALIEVWTLVALGMPFFVSAAAAPVAARGRASPAQLQRFLF